jgi:rhamnosyltransferase
MKKVLVIIILYHPDSKALIALVKNCLAYENSDVFLSDNGNIEGPFKHELMQLDKTRVFYHDNVQNVGIGEAQNKGIDFAFQREYDEIILFDQDSVIDDLFLKALSNEFEKARQKDPALIAAGPSFIDPRLKGKRALKQVSAENQYKKMIIASGCIISVSKLKQVGLMEGELFIDHVDTEWCYRARSKGYRVMQLARVVMTHTIGEIKKTWWGYNLQYHSPNRYYYLFRNSMLLFSRKYIPLKDRLYILLRNVTVLAKMPFLDRPFLRLRLIVKGFFAGIQH